MNRNISRKVATSVLSGGLLLAPVLGLAPAAFADVEEPPAVFYCAELDPSVAVPVPGEDGKCTINRAHLGRAVTPSDVTPATVPGLDPSLGIMPISAPINLTSPATDTTAHGTLVSIALAALAVGGTIYSLARHRRLGTEV